MESENEFKKIVCSIKGYWASQGISLADAARKMGISPQALSNRLTRPLNKRSALEFAALWPWSVNYLLTGEGSLVIEDKQMQPVLPEPAPKLEKTPCTYELYDVIRQQAETIRSQQQLIRQLTEKMVEGAPANAPFKKEDLDIFSHR